MSLQVWLPLTKDLRQQGLASVTVTNSGATYQSTGGKLGGCYYFDGTNDYITFVCQEFPTILAGDFSIAFWVYSDDDGTRSVYFGNYGISGGGNWFNLEKHTANEIRFWWNNGSPDKRFNSTHILASDGWVHFTLTKGNGIVNTYLNGQLIETYTNQNLSVAIPSTATTFRIGGDSRTSGDLMFKGKMNDFRVYDHCLSPMEVKQISQGLVLHYPLNRQGWGQENLVTNTHIEQSGVNTYKFWTFGANNNLTAGETCVVSFDAKSTVANVACDVYFRSSSGMVGSSKIINGIGTTYKRFSTTLTVPSSTYVSMAIRWNSNVSGANTSATYTFKDVKVEKGEIVTPWCPNSSDALAITMGLNSTTEYDCSGFCNNLNKNGTYSYTSDTPKYAVSTKFNGTEWINGTTPSAEIMTLACWAKTSKNKSTSQFMVADSTSNLCISFYSGCIIGVFGSTRGTGSKSTLGSSYKENDWNHFVVVKSGTSGERTIYCNGELLTPTSNDYWSVASGFFIGTRNTSAALPFYGQICDVRAYATALSASDVKSLYQNCATIDPDGTIRGQIRS